jgi:5'-nucleotidase
MENSFKILTVFLLNVLLSTVVFVCDAKSGDYNGKVDFRLFLQHNNDGESELLSDGDEGGVARFASVLGRARLAAWKWILKNRGKGGSLLVSSGDNFLASPAFTASLNDGVFYDAVALDLLRYSAICLGNHDFDFGPDLLADFISEGFRRPGRPPYLSANLDFKGEPSLQFLVDDDIIAESTVVWRWGEKIGIIGATTENLSFISSPRNVVINDVLAAVQAEVDKLTNRGVNKIILISHLQNVNQDIALASELRGVDIMVAGGGDELLAKCTTVDNCQNELLPSDLRDEENNETGEEIPDGIPDALFGSYPLMAMGVDGTNIPVVTTSGQYGYLGRLVVDFDKHGNVIGIDMDNSGPIRVVSKTYPDGVRKNPIMQRKVVDPVETFVADLAANIIATSEVDLDGIRNNVRSKETNQGNLIADSLLWQATQLADNFDVPKPDVALQNGGGIRNDSIIPAGDISELDTFDMVPFPNFVAVFPEISRVQFKEILENAVSRSQPDDIPGGTGRFAQISGFKFTFSGSGTAQELNPDGTVATPGTRVVDVVLDDGSEIVSDGVVVPGSDIVVATIDFLARGGDQYPFRDEPFTVLGVSYQQALSNYMQDVAGINGLISAVDYPEDGEGRITELP